MKFLTLIVSASLFSLCSCSQDIPAGKVPSVVLNTVQAKFGNAGKIEWEKKNNLYEAEFKMDSTDYSVYIDPASKLVMHKQNIKKDELPAALSTVIRTEYDGYRIDEVEKVVKDGVIFYQVELEGKGKKDLELVFTADGKPSLQMNYLK